MLGAAFYRKGLWPEIKIGSDHDGERVLLLRHLSAYKPAKALRASPARSGTARRNTL
jgi:hypothetical protein